MQARTQGGGGGALGARAPPPKKKFRSETSKRGKKVPPSTVGRQKRMQDPLRYDKIKKKLGKGKKEERRKKRKGVKEKMKEDSRLSEVEIIK